MPLFELTTAGAFHRVRSTSFAAEHVLERTDPQRTLRNQISVIGPDLLVVAEDFGDFADVRRLIDLLCVDTAGQLVVVELKRTEDSGHMELQASPASAFWLWTAGSKTTSSPTSSSTPTPRAHERLRRWFLAQPIHENDKTWVLSELWGTNTLPTLDALLELAPTPGYGYQAAT